ncbi:DoxX-like family protein [Pseudarcicella hirudinis]|uniref:DoxX-like family protein n=1 Tax=Pseudarcicella hirudinis TaxID=1079859 RepID=A0A1I5X2G1_9BACT|nr:DoxX family protein [Pseudarcicella hirudinis]SFQ26061.1 DoxX-like family protein [Pseudarcicella hirudinis]
MKTLKITDWVLRLIAALILLQTLFFKFSAAPESVYIFTTVGMEPWGRIGSGIAELICSVLLLLPGTTWLGASGAVGVMAGAIFFHLTKLGIEVMGDGGQLFFMAVIVMLCSLALLWMHRSEISRFLKILIP